jgi:hypothetical protein
MIAPSTYKTTLSVNLVPRQNVSTGLSRIFSAAVVNKQFCSMLLEDPTKALKNGYLGETFPLSKEEHDLIISIRAHSLSDLAKQINRSLSINF